MTYLKNDLAFFRYLFFRGVRILRMLKIAPWFWFFVNIFRSRSIIEKRLRHFLRPIIPNILQKNEIYSSNSVGWIQASVWSFCQVQVVIRDPCWGLCHLKYCHEMPEAVLHSYRRKTVKLLQYDELIKRFSWTYRL